MVSTHGLPEGVKLTVLIVASLAATATRYVALRTRVFSRNGCAVGDGTGHTLSPPRDSLIASHP
jgi:hypothetical protein